MEADTRCKTGSRARAASPAKPSSAHSSGGTARRVRGQRVVPSGVSLFRFFH